MCINQNCQCKLHKMDMNIKHQCFFSEKTAKENERASFACGIAVAGLSIFLAMVCRPFLAHIFTFCLGMFTTLAYTLLIIIFLIMVLMVAGVKCIGNIVKCTSPNFITMLAGMALTFMISVVHIDNKPSQRPWGMAQKEEKSEEDKTQEEEEEMPKIVSMIINRINTSKDSPDSPTEDNTPDSPPEDKTATNHSSLCQTCKEFVVNTTKESKGIVTENSTFNAWKKDQDKIIEKDNKEKDNKEREAAANKVCAEFENVFMTIFKNRLPADDLDKFVKSFKTEVSSTIKTVPTTEINEVLGPVMQTAIASLKEITHYKEQMSDEKK